jgi:hypothetical protein
MTKTKAKVEDKVPISERALIQRINRVLTKRNEVLKTTRNKSLQAVSLGRYFIVNSNGLKQKNIDLEDYARTLDVLQSWEQLVS